MLVDALLFFARLFGLKTAFKSTVARSTGKIQCVLRDKQFFYKIQN
jgi:hypothetical protein